MTGTLESRQPDGFLVNVGSLDHGFLPAGSPGTWGCTVGDTLNDLCVTGHGPQPGFDTHGPIMAIIRELPAPAHNALDDSSNQEGPGISPGAGDSPSPAASHTTSPSVGPL